MILIIGFIVLSGHGCFSDEYEYPPELLKETNEINYAELWTCEGYFDWDPVEDIEGDGENEFIIGSRGVLIIFKQSVEGELD